MTESLLPLTFLLPLAGTLLLALGGGRPGERGAVWIGTGSVGLAAGVTAIIGTGFALGDQTPQTQTLYTWIAVGDFTPTVSLGLDALSLTMLAVITGVGFLIHWFAGWYMRGEDGITRFYAYMNLFVFSMVLLVLADNLLLLFLGWEGVGLCSYLLIGYYYRDSANGAAAMKAFIVTRIGDVFLAIGLFLLFAQFGTLDISGLVTRATQAWSVGEPLAQLTALLILGGALGKSAQLPLHTWLADAMAGPTPVSALIHAATMVTAGVYLIARLHGLFELAPAVLYLVGMIGALTLLMAGFAALAQTDIKRVLAYSTMSQIGYMFLALGAGAYSAGIFHLVTHAFFKALLFLAAGAVIVCCHHEQDMRRLGGLRRRLPLVYFSFVVGGAALAALPLVTAGFYSKDEILWQAFAADRQGLFSAGLLGSLLTGLYTLRLIVGTFHGQTHSEAAETAQPGRGLQYQAPLILLMVLSTLIGAWLRPDLSAVFPAAPGAGVHTGHTAIQWIASATAIAGISFGAWLFFTQGPRLARLITGGVGGFLWRWWHRAFGFDGLYERLLVQPFLILVRGLRRDWLDALWSLAGRLAFVLHAGLSLTQSGRLRHYAAAMAVGATLVLLVLTRT